MRQALSEEQSRARHTAANVAMPLRINTHTQPRYADGRAKTVLADIQTQQATEQPSASSEAPCH
jgi:hypothetical protein